MQNFGKVLQFIIVFAPHMICVFRPHRK